jgi:ElaB/YqjD/DUF883 family membrane-anchored ribosome-binding protein
MWKSDKETIQDKSEELASAVGNAAESVTDSAKVKAEKAANEIARATNETKYQANDLMLSLKKLVNDYADNTSVDELKDRLTSKASELKSVVTDEVSHAYATGKEKASTAVKEHPVGTIALVAGVGLLLGYVLGSKHSSK